jgi:hypothetical protein
MKVIITERQISNYIRRRFSCMREYIDQLKSGEVKLPVPPTSFEWNTYKYVIVVFIRQECSDTGGFFSQEIHDEIMNYFGDELYDFYKMNK